MKALLIGGTGTISLSTTKLLLQNGWDVTLLNRGNRPLPTGANSLVADIHDEEALAAKLQDAQYDVVADFISYLPQDVERAHRLFRGKCGQYIFISSASAYQKPLSRLPITESTPLANPYWQYSRDKIACEELLMRWHREESFPVTIVRPSHTYDERSLPLGLHGEGGSWVVLQRMLAGKPIIIQGDGASLWTFTHARDFAKGFVGLMANPHAIGEAVHITSDETLTWNAAYTSVAKALGVQLVPQHVPSSLIVEAGKAYGYDFEGPLFGDKAVTVQFDNSKIKQLVPGFVCTTRYDEGAREAIAYAMQHKEVQKPDKTYDAFSDKLCEVMKAAGAAFKAPV